MDRQNIFTPPAGEREKWLVPILSFSPRSLFHHTNLLKSFRQEIEAFLAEISSIARQPSDHFVVGIRGFASQANIDYFNPRGSMGTLWDPRADVDEAAVLSDQALYRRSGPFYVALGHDLSIRSLPTETRAVALTVDSQHDPAWEKLVIRLINPQIADDPLYENIEALFLLRERPAGNFRGEEVKQSELPAEFQQLTEIEAELRRIWG